MSDYQAPVFLTELLKAKSPSGAEAQAQAVYDAHVKPHADAYANDALGNRLASLNLKGDPTLMMAGHMDELGLMIIFVSKDGFLYFDTVGGHDLSIISGRRVIIQTAAGPIKGVTGKRAVHLMDDEDRKKVPKKHEIWIDIGAKTKAEALKRVAIGDVATYDHEFELITGSIGTARAFDNKVGAYIVGETLIRLAREKARLNAKVVSVATTQEEIGTRGAQTSAFAVDPHVALIGAGERLQHACPRRRAAEAGARRLAQDPRLPRAGGLHQAQLGVEGAILVERADKVDLAESKLGSGPIICRGPNINPKVFDRLVACAKKARIPHQIEADPRPTGTDARAIQMARGGVACGLVSIPLRYMHTPSEVVDLQDVENCVKLFAAFAKSVGKGESFNW